MPFIQTHGLPAGLANKHEYVTDHDTHTALAYIGHAYYEIPAEEISGDLLYFSIRLARV